jgi:hypothetical protein
MLLWSPGWLKLTNLLRQPLKSWDYNYMPPHPARNRFLKKKTPKLFLLILVVGITMVSILTKNIRLINHPKCTQRSTGNFTALVDLQLHDYIEYVEVYIFYAELKNYLKI